MTHSIRKTENITVQINVHQKIANDIQNLNSDIEGVQNRGAGTAPSGEDATEEQLTDAFDGVTIIHHRTHLKGADRTATT